MVVYDVSKDNLSCHICKRQSKKINLFAERCKENVFLESRCKNWKKATKKFNKHETSNCHKTALADEVVLPTSGDTAEMLNENERKNR